MDNTPSSSLVPDSNHADSVIWSLTAEGFSIKSAWGTICRVVKPDVPWWKSVSEHSKECSDACAGPGCSSIAYGMVEELGPFHIAKDEKTLYLNPYA
ncbi:hypothetical protein RHMOL_Rhmol01G0019800 [Rhododendron molle]|uniref:Uncharacterized protein n=1 Tax=Rhododendron molle TaxID=49168 RepID=A0ACC0Q006_RHOML|nr:hypothetical protein RHMOL_Rhmol01G0019800 [Rhododendron molle]